MGFTLRQPRLIGPTSTCLNIDSQIIMLLTWDYDLSRIEFKGEGTALLELKGMQRFA